MRKLLLAGLFSLYGICCHAQSILTAGAFFQSVSEHYGTIKNFEADLEISVGRNDMSGKVSFKRPDMLRIDFSKPANQVIVFNGDTLTIYLPDVPAILNQTVSNEEGISLATPQGLALMSRYYTVAYETGQAPEPLYSGSDEMVVKLVLYRRNAAEAFRSIKLAVNPDTLLIRRVEAVTPQAETFVFNFANYVINQGIPDQRFIYDAPSSANNYNNFLFSE